MLDITSYVFTVHIYIYCGLHMFGTYICCLFFLLSYLFIISDAISDITSYVFTVHIYIYCGLHMFGIYIHIYMLFFFFTFLFIYYF